MNRALALFLIGLVFGGGIGFTLAAGNGISFDGHDHADPAQHGGAGDHDHLHQTALEVPAADAPRLAITVTPDPVAGHNLHLETANFAFSPENAGGANITGQGHAHVYVNGEKLGRLYGAWMHLDHLPKGTVEVEVTLNTNDHRPLAVDGTAVAARQTITVE